MIKLNEKQRGAAQDLLSDYQKICDTLADVDRRMFQIYLTSDKEEEGSDFSEVLVTRAGAKALLQSEKEWTEKELKKLGIEV